MNEPPAETPIPAWVVQDRQSGRIFTGPTNPSPRYPAYRRPEDAYVALAWAEAEQPLGQWEVARIELDPRSLPHLDWPAAGDPSR